MTSGNRDTSKLKLPLKIPGSFIAEVLRPYRSNARYLKTASITHFRDKADDGASNGATGFMNGTGTFAIPQSCYIDDTGHFNAVEFNICFNQLAYTLFAKCVHDGLMQKLRLEKVDVISFPQFKQQQLPSMLIVSIEGVRFFKQLKSEAFYGDFVLERVAPVGAAWFFFTSVRFGDLEGIKAKGSIVLAFTPTPLPRM
jgi:hypothetical protein